MRRVMKNINVEGIYLQSSMMTSNALFYITLLLFAIIGTQVVIGEAEPEGEGENGSQMARGEWTATALATGASLMIAKLLIK